MCLSGQRVARLVQQNAGVARYAVDDLVFIVAGRAPVADAVEVEVGFGNHDSLCFNLMGMWMLLTQAAWEQAAC